MLKLFNTRTRQIEPFAPIHPPDVGLYTCGPTVYDFVHLGNLRTYIFEDVLRRVLEFNHFQVAHVMNVTDVGHLTGDADSGIDKIEASARKEGKDAHAIAKFYADSFFNNLNDLNILHAQHILWATRTIDLQIALIRRLQQRGYTYRTSDGIYFDTSRLPSYGQLGGQKADDKRAGSRVEVSPEKRHAADFALWKLSTPNQRRQMEWKSPWGIGFPGWHIECSAMSMSVLGEQFDIHTGGTDHIPIHHENEIAQSEAATGKRPFVKYWLHGEFLILPEKRMGKSEGNAIRLQHMADRGIHPLAFRYLVLQTHYRSPLLFSWDALEAAQRGLKRVWAMLDDNDTSPRIGCAEYERRFQDAVNDDLNTPQALSIMHEMLGSQYPWRAKLQSLMAFDQVLALGLSRNARRGHFQAVSRDVRKKVDPLIVLREQARKEKNWKRADELRNEINASLAPYERVLDDTPEGSEIRPR